VAPIPSATVSAPEEKRGLPGSKPKPPSGYEYQSPFLKKPKKDGTRFIYVSNLGNIKFINVKLLLWSCIVTNSFITGTTARKEDVMQYFHQFGNVLECSLRKGATNHRGFCFIEFEDESAAEMVCQMDHNLNGNDLQVKPSKTPDAIKPPPQVSGYGRNILTDPTPAPKTTRAPTRLSGKAPEDSSFADKVHYNSNHSRMNMFIVRQRRTARGIQGGSRHYSCRQS
jgi:RNA recognition motif-containing protein